MRPRISLSTLLVLTALAAAACYLWITRPTNVAKQFIAALDRRDYAAADTMFFARTPAYFARFMKEKTPAGQWKAILLPRTWQDLWRAHRQIELQFDYGSLRSDDPISWERPYGPVIATPTHIEIIITPPRKINKKVITSHSILTEPFS